MHNILRLGAISVLLALSSSVLADIQYWKDKSNQQSLAALAAKTNLPRLKARMLELDESALKKALGLEVSQQSGNARRAVVKPEIVIPLPAGGELTLYAEEVMTLSPELAQQFPDIKTWRVFSNQEQEIHGRIDVTEQGFHAMLDMPDGDTVFIEPVDSFATDNQNKQYLSFSKQQNHGSFKSDFQCQVHTTEQPVASFLQQNKVRAKAAHALITYRLAVAATGEYTQFHGGSVGSALSAIVTSINRVNQIFERDLGINLQLIPEETSIIYTNPATDPYSSNDINAMLDENLLNLSNSGALSQSRYDIGHLFTATNVGGLASVGSTCDNTLKAAGVTGIINPLGDAFDISYVAHELGHQLGGTHTFNSTCRGGQRTATTAVEPGSGSTIMSYAGVCGDGNDLQSQPDPQMHAVSIQQISDYTRLQSGSVCGSAQGVSNQDPVISAGPDYTLPTRTPFMLQASASDIDGDVVTYTWDQIDAGTETDVDVDAGDNAIFRSRPENISRIRYIPRLSDLFAGVSVKGERLPVNDRSVNFMATARDGKGGIEMDQMHMRLVSTGRPFIVTSHRFNDTFATGDITTVQWDVAGTRDLPVSCPRVDISLVTADGSSFFIQETTNDGSQKVTIPSDTPTMTNARFMVACSNNLFFNISGGNLRIIAGSGSGGGSSGGGSLGEFIWLLGLLALIRKRAINGGLK